MCTKDGIVKDPRKLPKCFEKFVTKKHRLKIELITFTIMKKNLYIIAGCNGAGKATAASFIILPEILDCKEFVNAHEIAIGLSLF